MSVARMVGVAIGGAVLAIAGVALAANLSSSNQSDFYAAGKHEFYVWCARTPDYMATAEGSSAEDAQMRLYKQVKAAGKLNCWPLWQGRVSS